MDYAADGRAGREHACQVVAVPGTVFEHAEEDVTHGLRGVYRPAHRCRSPDPAAFKMRLLIL
jgi:hypothetical protein